ncbi:MAG: DUF4160 domain-containing protein [Gammaproteobacteria bacterium]
MPTVKRFNRCRIEMYFADHPPPHFHVITRQNERISIVIETLVIQAGEADSRDTAEALTWARENRAELRSRWQEYSEEES